MNVLVVNVGSSSVKLQVVDQDDELLANQELDGPAQAHEIREFAEDAPTFHAIGHRIVHGGAKFTEPTLIDAANLHELDSLCDLAPLHNPPAIEVLRAAVAWEDGCPNVACFDTTFHATLSEAARTYAIPERWRTELGVRRYGFHGLSHAYVSRRAAELLEHHTEDFRLVSCHLGAGASLAAVENGRSVDTTMGFTPVEGLVMATRAGDFDPGAIAWLLNAGEAGADELDEVLNRQSGLMALAGTADMRAVLDRRHAGEPGATLAVAVYVHRLGKAIAAMAAAMSGVDALVFTGGIGENAPTIRALACERLGFLGVEIDPELNMVDGQVDFEVGARGARARVAVIHACEELEIATQVRRTIRG